MEKRHVVLRDNSPATIFPVRGNEKVPDSVAKRMRVLFNEEIERGQTYPYLDQLSEEEFRDSWLSKFCAIMVEGTQESLTEKDEILGFYYVKPNYVGRCSHVCNAGFIVNPSTRGRGVGRLLGESYLVYGPLLGYRYSVFNLVFVTNVASVKIWDSLGFDRIGRVPGVAKLKGHDGYIDAIIFGKDFTQGNSA